jgi:hypothetical protein
MLLSQAQTCNFYDTFFLSCIGNNVYDCGDWPQKETALKSSILVWVLTGLSQLIAQVTNVGNKPIFTLSLFNLVLVR